MAGSTGIKPATSGLTVQCANQAAPRAPIRTHICTMRRAACPSPPTPGATLRLAAGARSAARRGVHAVRAAFEPGCPRALSGETREQVSDLLARRLVPGQVEARVASERPVDAQEIGVHGLERPLLA